jgi:hypothetical protein
VNRMKPDPNAKFAFDMILGCFDGNIDRANHWFNTFNESLGAVPASLVKIGLTQVLINWIKSQPAENICDIINEDEK